MRRSIFKCSLCLLCLIFMLLGCGSKENENINNIENSEDGIVHTESSEGESTELTGNLEEAFPVRSEDGMQVLEERFYLLHIDDAFISNEFFTMEVPQELVGKISCILELDTSTEQSILKKVSFFIDELAEGYTPKEDAESCFDLTDSGLGWMGSIFWDDFTNYEEKGVLEDLIYRSGTVDISKMSFCYNMLVAPVSRYVVAANEAGTGAYFLIKPSDIQFMQEQEQMYQVCSAALYESIDTFHPTVYPMEKSYSELFQEGFLPPEPPLEPASDVLWNFQEAEKAYAWFTGYGEVATNWDEQFTLKTENGTEIIYAATKHIDFRTMKEFQNYLNCYFPERTVKRLLETKLPGTNLSLFQEKDGVLYTATGHVGEIAFQDYEAEFCIVENEKTENIENGKEGSAEEKTATLWMLVHANIWGEDIVEQLAYRMILGEDHHWRVTEDFELPIQKLLDSIDE